MNILERRFQRNKKLCKTTKLKEKRKENIGNQKRFGRAKKVPRAVKLFRESDFVTAPWKSTLPFPFLSVQNFDWRIMDGL